MFHCIYLCKEKHKLKEAGLIYEVFRACDHHSPPKKLSDGGKPVGPNYSMKQGIGTLRRVWRWWDKEHTLMTVWVSGVEDGAKQHGSDRQTILASRSFEKYLEHISANQETTWLLKCQEIYIYNMSCIYCYRCLINTLLSKILIPNWSHILPVKN